MENMKEALFVFSVVFSSLVILCGILYFVDPELFDEYRDVKYKCFDGKVYKEWNGIWVRSYTYHDTCKAVE